MGNVRSLFDGVLAASAVVACVGLLAPSLVQAGSAEKVTIGGWAGFKYEDSNKQGGKAGFDAHPLYVYVQGEPVEGYRVFAEVEGEHVFKLKGDSTSGDGEFKLERLYLERNFSTALNARAGKFFMPFGYWYRLHWLFLTGVVGRPFSFNNQYAPRYQVGLEGFGRLFLGDNTDLKYYAWVGDGPDQFGTNKRSVERFGFGGSAFATHKIGGDPDYTIGGTVGVHVQSVNQSEDQLNVVGGIEAKIKRLELRGEYYVHEREAMVDLWTWYGNALLWVLPRVGLNYRFDHGEDFKRAGSVQDPETMSHNIGVIWRPHPQVLLSTEYRINDFKGAGTQDFKDWNVFLALKF